MPCLILYYRVAYYNYYGGRSLSRASVVFTACEDGTIQCWNLLAGGNSPIQRQNTSGYTITCITGYWAGPAHHQPADIAGHFLSIGIRLRC